MPTRRSVVITVLVLSGLGGLIQYWWQHMEHLAAVDLAQAEQAWVRKDWAAVRVWGEMAGDKARTAALRDRAWSLVGRSYLVEPGVPRSKSLPVAMEYLTRVAATSREFPEIALVVAHDKLFSGRNPQEAASWINEGLRWHPSHWRLRLWQIQTATVEGKLPLVEPSFLATDPKIPGTEWDLFLRTWLLCHFAATEVETDFDRNFGVAGQTEATNDVIRLERWITLNRIHAQDPGHYAAIAQWYLDRAQPTVAWEYLKAGQSAAEIRPNALYLSVLIRALCEADRVEDARRVVILLGRLPAHYWQPVARARVALAEHQPERAMEQLETARKIWPGRLDDGVSQLLEQLYRQQGGPTALAQAEELAADRRWLAEQRQLVAQAQQRWSEPEYRQQLASLLKKLDRPIELEWLAALEDASPQR